MGMEMEMWLCFWESRGGPCGWLQAEGWQELGFMFQFPLETSLHTCKQPHFFHFHLLQNYIDEINDLRRHQGWDVA